MPRSPRAIVVHALDLVAWNSPDAIVAVSCSKGTYVRVLAEDIGEALGCGAHLAALRRTATGGFGIDHSVPFERLEAMADADRLAALRPASALVADMASLTLDDGDGRRFSQGQAVPAKDGRTGNTRCTRRAGCSGLRTSRAASRGRAGWSRQPPARLDGKPLFGL